MGWQVLACPGCGVCDYVPVAARWRSQAGGVAVLVPCSALLCLLAGPFGVGRWRSVDSKVTVQRKRSVATAVPYENSK
jgi:hypothetical protein